MIEEKQKRKARQNRMEEKQETKDDRIGWRRSRRERGRQNRMKEKQKRKGTTE